MLLLEDLLAAEDFAKSVNDLAGEFRRRHDLPGIRQLGLVVPDVERAAIALEARGMGPLIISSGSPAMWRERGENRTVSGKMGLAYHEGFELELLEPTQGSDFYRQSMDSGGRPVLQHLGFFVDDVDKWTERLIATEVPVLIRGQLKMGPVSVEFAYMDTLKEVGLIVEFICWRIRGRTFMPPPGVTGRSRWMERFAGRHTVPD